MRLFILLPFAVAVIHVTPGQAQRRVTRFDLAAMLENHSMRVVGRAARVLTDGSARGVGLDERDGTGIAWLGNRRFVNGVIEFDVRGKDDAGHSFVGIAFHGQNDSTYDAVYLRPFNFRSPDSLRKLHAVQYISSPRHDWDALRRDYPGKYEKGIIPAPDPNGWVHVRIVVDGTKITVYINRSSKPSLNVEQIERLSGGRVGLWAGNTSGGDWANVTVSSGL